MSYSFQVAESKRALLFIAWRVPGTPVNDVKNTDIPSKKKNTEPAGGVTFFLNSRIEPISQKYQSARCQQQQILKKRTQ